MPKTAAERQACTDLVCSHPRCAHGRPHCPMCPAQKAPGWVAAPKAPTCAACNAAPAASTGNVCEACAEVGVEAPDLFGAP